MKLNFDLPFFLYGFVLLKNNNNQIDMGENVGKKIGLIDLKL